MKIRYLLAILATACLLGGSALAQTPPPPKHHGLLGGMMGRHQHGMMGHPMLGGRVIGNKNTHVYHLPSDKSPLPEPKNRVYFRSEADAIRAGYHHAGAGAGGHHGMMGGHMHGMKGGKMKPMTHH